MYQKTQEYSIRGILEKEFDRYWQNRSIPHHKLKVVQSILDCRTPAYGGHMYGCPDEHYSLILFNSCKKRNCPTCQGAEIEYWHHVQKERILNTGHYHIVFKQPEILHSEFMSNYTEYARLLFDASRDTIKEILSDRIKPGIILLLHTHGRNNEIHPHIHCAITDGGMNERGEYEKFDEELLSVENVSRIYQKQYLRKLRKRIKNRRIKHEKSPIALSKIISEKDMSVFISNRYDRGEWLISYFARYSRGGSIRDNQIIHVDDSEVRFKYRNDNNQYIETEMKIDTFIQRFLFHIPPDRFKTIRYCGLYATGCVDDLDLMRKHLRQEPYKKPKRQDVFDKESLVCPHCKNKLIHLESFERNTIPFFLLRKMNFNPTAIIKQYWQAPDKIFGIKYHWSEFSSGPPVKQANRIA